jgi:hypothetical protein
MFCTRKWGAKKEDVLIQGQWQQKLSAQTTSYGNQADTPTKRANKSSMSNIRPYNPTSHSNSSVGTTSRSRPVQTRRVSLDESRPSIASLGYGYGYGQGQGQGPGPVHGQGQGYGQPLGRQQGGGGPQTPVKKGGLGVPAAMGLRYAGPTFHNSPSAASLPKPDLDDF